MSGPRVFENSLTIIEAVAAAGMLIRFLWTGLNQIYRCFFAYLIIFLIQAIGSPLITRRSNAYGWFFFITEGLIGCLYALITLELYSLVLRDLTGIATVARRFIRIALGLSIFISLLLLGIEQTPKNIIASFFSVERPIVTSLIFFLFLITGFLVYYPVVLNRNVIYYTIGYSIYFSSKATALLLVNTGHDWNRMLSQTMLGVSAACLIFWLFALTPGGETKGIVLGKRASPAEEELLLRQLRAINAGLWKGRNKA